MKVQQALLALQQIILIYFFKNGDPLISIGYALWIQYPVY